MRLIVLTVIVISVGCATPSSGPSKSRVYSMSTQELIAMRGEYGCRIQTGNSGPRRWPEYAQIMEELLDVWGPVGAMRSDLVFILGPGEEVENQDLLYICEDGILGRGWLFRMEADRIVSVEEIGWH